MKIFIEVSSPGPAESLALLVKKLRISGLGKAFIDVFNLNGHCNSAGCLLWFARDLEKMEIGFIEADAFGALPDYFGGPIDFAGAKRRGVARCPGKRIYLHLRI